MNILYGGFRPCFLTTEDFEKGMQKSEHFCSSDFREEYQKHLSILSIIAESAKVYVLNNWTKIEDWSKLDIIVLDNTGKPTEYYNYVPFDVNQKGSETWKRIVNSMNELHKEKHNPIVSVEDVVLDPTDGDFSLTINGKTHLWISDETVIILADYIEKTLKTNTSPEV
jgi:hypothetical protein